MSEITTAGSLSSVVRRKRLYEESQARQAAPAIELGRAKRGQAMDQQTMTLIAAMIAAVVSIVSLLLNSRITLDRERRLVLWRKEVDRLFELEELAGRLVEDIGSYHSLERMRDRLASQLERLEDMAGRMARYPKVRQAVRDLHNVLGRLFTERRDNNDDRMTRGELDPAHRMLLDACDSVLGRRSL